jgi:hypothetical protein
MWPKQNTAFLVIHGIGAHRPFETLDAFARGFWDMLKNQNRELKVQWKHKLQRHNDWIENYVSLAPDGKPTLDFYEYYWDCYMVREVTMGEVVRWLDQASVGARRFYHELGKGKAKKHQKAKIDLFKDGEFEFRGYRRILVAALSQVRWLALLSPLLGSIPRVGGLIKPLANIASERIVNLLGDLVIYTTSDVRSRNYEIRQKMLSGAVEELRLLLNNDYYQQIIVAGHSLGSVVAYDALNRITQDISSEGGISPDLALKIAGLVTFGSPLDKIAFFFQEHAPRENFVQRQILAHFHSYKGITLPGDNDPIAIDDPIRHDLDKSVWLNFYHLNDLISGHLDAYKLDENIQSRKKVGIIEAHTHYWKYNRMYRKIAEQFF